MKHPKLWRALFFMTVLYHLGMSSRYGCVFERRLCSREQFCSDDGLFGQCRTSKQDQVQYQVQYQVSVPVLKRMQEVLKQLTLQGLSWQDDITQYIVTKELSRVPHTPRSSSSSSSQPKQSSSNQGGYPSSSSNQGGYPSSSSNQGGYPSSSSNQGGYPSSSSNQGGYPSSSSNQGGYPKQSSSNQGGYPSSSSNQGGYPKQSSSNQGGYPSSSSKSGTSQADSYQDYMILDHPQFPLRMRTSPIDPYTYQQEDVERSLHQGGRFYPVPRPSSRSQQAKQRERDRQLLQDVISLYLSSSPAQPLFRHRGAADLPASPYYEDLELPVDYVEDYSLTEQATARARQQLQQQKMQLQQQKMQLQQQQQKKVPQDYSSLAGLDESVLQRMVETLERYGVDPRDLTPQQLYRLAVVLQLMKAEDQENTDPFSNDLITLKETQQMLKSSDTVSNKGENSPVPVPPPSSTTVPDVSPNLAPAATSPTLTAPIGGSVTAKGPSVSVEGKEKGSNVPAGNRDVIAAAGGGTAAREEYGYIVTNQSPLSLYEGVKLLELLAERIHLTTRSFINISVVGPALTFRIRQNPQNMSAEDVAGKT
ncbi:receptor-type tyrosine-protein phosphatase-like N, partial [Coregonus clupeaformis]|uniref:receptor-type tyrosine-protein phosphatase-like N n=1 Tax=Coregonus clupeaformis TaxID=59861 RepID=UPI001E1C294C